MPSEDAPIFFEFFAGNAELSIAVKKMGIRIVADDLLYGGTDFLDAAAVEAAKERIRISAAEGRQVALHLAPPCATFSRGVTVADGRA